MPVLQWLPNVTTFVGTEYLIILWVAHLPRDMLRNYHLSACLKDLKTIIWYVVPISGQEFEEVFNVRF